MKIEIYTLTEAQAREIATKEAPKDHCVHINKMIDLSTTLLLARYGDEDLCVFGLVPETILTETAHLWVQDFAALKSHRLIFARESRKVIQNLLQLYPKIVGFCVTRSAMQWLQWVGAEFGPPINNAIPFIFRRT